MTAPRRGHSSGDGSFARDAGTQTTKAVILVAIAVLVAVLMLSHTPSGSNTVRTSASHGTAALRPAAPSTTSTTSTTAPQAPAPDTVKVAVFNGTTTPHGAGYFSSKLQGLGYNTLAPENADVTTVTTSEVFALTSTYSASAGNIARALGLPGTAVHTGLPAATPVSSSVVRQIAPDVVVLVGADIANQSLSFTPTTTAQG